MTSHIQYSLLTELEQAFDLLVTNIESLVEVYRRQPGAAWAFDHPRPDADWLRNALLDIWYEDGRDGRVTRSYIGLIAADNALVDRVIAVNTAKQRFGNLIGQIQASDPKLIGEIKSSLPKRHEALNAHLGGRGMARLHLKQAWRHLPLADAEVLKVRMAWYSSGRSIRKVTVSEAEQMLHGLDTEATHIRVQLKKLAGIPSGEPLARVQRQAPLMRANLFFREPLEDGRLRKAMNAALPVFLPSPDGQLPHYNRPPPFPPEKRLRAKRSDEKLEEEPYLPSIHVYRYRA